MVLFLFYEVISKLIILVNIKQKVFRYCTLHIEAAIKYASSTKKNVRVVFLEGIQNNLFCNFSSSLYCCNQQGGSNAF